MLREVANSADLSFAQAREPSVVHGFQWKRMIESRGAGLRGDDAIVRRSHEGGNNVLVMRS